MKIIKDLGRIKLNNDKQNRHYLLVECESCGKEKTIRKGASNLLCRSCGGVKASTKHGMTNTRQYRVWDAMIQRTTNKNAHYHEFYKDKVPPKKWFTFEGFWDDMKEGYSDGLQIDRIDNNKPYSKDNCRWTTVSIQHQNTRLLHKHNKSGYRGVSQTPSGKYDARCQLDKKLHLLGLHETKEEAAKAYDTFVIDNNLEFPTNFERTA